VATAILVLLLNPAQVGQALAGFQLALIPAILVAFLGIYVLQGVRWHYLLADAGAPLRLSDSLLVNAAGQTITAIVPLGDLTRAAFASEATKRDFGTIAATVTVQELTFNLMLVLCALPILLTVHLGVAVVVATVAGMAAIVVILTVSPVFCAVHRLVAHIPLLRRLLPAIDELQHETADLLHRPDALALSVLDLGRAIFSIAAIWLVVQGLSPGTVDPAEAAFVLAISSIGGAISLVPGGVGANEASVAGLLIVFGVDHGGAGAAALLWRFLLTGVAIGFGLVAYLLVRRKLSLGGIFQVTAHAAGR
jgi:glycosyltransferase 2 family protein